MAHLTEKENYLRCLRGEVPEWVPTMTFGGMMGPPELVPMIGGWEGERQDMFGVTYVTEKTINCGALPKPGVFILDDITKWRDVIKRPAILDEIDWQLCADRDLANYDPSTILSGSARVGNGYFEMLVSFLGFDNGLIACMEEPDEVKDLLNFILELNLELGKKFLYYYKPETSMGADDIAHERAPFISEELFVDIFEPMWRQDIAIYKDAGCLAEHHNCGMFGPFVKYIVDMGYNAWNPAEAMNDLVAIKKEFGNKMVISGGFDGRGFCSLPETTEEEIRAYTKKVLDDLAPGGGYCFGGFISGPVGDPEETARRNEWVRDVYESLKFSYYE